MSLACVQLDSGISSARSHIYSIFLFIFFQNVTLEQDKNLTKSLAELVLSCDGRCRLTVRNKTFAVYNQLRSFAINGFAEVRIRRQGLHVRNKGPNFAVSIAGVQRLYLETSAVQPYAGTVDVVIEDCGEVRLASEVIAKLRSFVFRRIGSLALSENTFKNAADNSVIEKVKRFPGDRVVRRVYPFAGCGVRGVTEVVRDLPVEKYF